jgi:hypothetical protein
MPPGAAAQEVDEAHEEGQVESREGVAEETGSDPCTAKKRNPKGAQR